MTTLEELKEFKILTKSMQQITAGREVIFERVDGLCQKVIEKNNKIVKIKIKPRYDKKCN